MQAPHLWKTARISQRDFEFSGMEKEIRPVGKPLDRARLRFNACLSK
jgi:hypothetical protein